MNRTSTKSTIKDYWRTSPKAVADAEALIGAKFVFDACAKDEASIIKPKLPAFVESCGDDALGSDAIWGMINIDQVYGSAIRGPGWCNPPFSRKTEFLEKAAQQAKSHGIMVCCMIPLEPATKWWRECVEGKATRVFIPDGRYNFLHPDSGEEIKGVSFPSCFAVFTSMGGPTQYVHFNRGVGGME